MVVYMSTVFVAGFLSFFAPCTFALMPVYIGLLADPISGGKFIRLGKQKIAIAPILKTLLFIGGLSTTFILLGFGAGALGSIINQSYFLVFSGCIVVLLGFHQLGLFRIKLLEKYKVFHVTNSGKNVYLTAYLLGLTFSFGWTPCIGPVLGAVLVISASGGQALYGGFLMLLYTIGLAIPFIVFALFTNVLVEKFSQIEKHISSIKKLGGVLIVIMGVMLMTQSLNKITGFIGRLF